LELVLRVRAAVALGEARPTVDLEPPALVVGQVQVQHVQLVERQHVDDPLDLGDRHEPAHDVEAEPPPRQLGGVDEAGARDGAGTGRRQLQQRGHAPVHRLLRGAQDTGTGLGHLQLVPLDVDVRPVGPEPAGLARRRGRGADLQAHRAGVGNRPDHGRAEGHRGIRGEVGAEALGDREQRRLGDRQHRRRREHERAHAAGVDRHGGRDHRHHRHGVG